VGSQKKQNINVSKITRLLFALSSKTSLTNVFSTSDLKPTQIRSKKLTVLNLSCCRSHRATTLLM